MKKIKNIISIILIIFIFLFLFLIIYNFVNTKILKKDYTSIFGYTCFEVVSGSMEPTIMKNDLVIIKETKEIKKGDIVTFKDEKNYVTHRIKQISKDNIITQGDANNNLDKVVVRKNVVGKKVLVIPKAGLIRRTILSPKVLLSIIITLFVISIAYSYKRFIRKKLKKPVKGLNPNIYLSRKNISKNIDRNRFKEIIRFNILIITFIILISIIPITISRYDSTAIGRTSTNIAFYLLKPNYVTNNVKLTTLTPSNNPYVYTFSVSNYDSNDTSEVDLEYTLQVVTTTNLPLTYKLYLNEDYTSASSTNLVTNNNTTVTQDDDGTYFKHITLSKESLYYSTPTINNYTLLIYYTTASADAKYQNTIESIRIIIDSNQIVGN